MDKKGVPTTTFGWILANWQLSLKNLTLLYLFDTEKVETIIL